jgi:hypothetical protein
MSIGIMMMLHCDSATLNESNRRVIRSRDIALVHDPWAVALREFRLWYISKAHFLIADQSYNAMPNSSVVPEDDILFLVGMSVDVLWR